jgi:hypothetical protein
MINFKRSTGETAGNRRKKPIGRVQEVPWKTIKERMKNERAINLAPCCRDKIQGEKRKVNLM